MFSECWAVNAITCKHLAGHSDALPGLDWAKPVKVWLIGPDIAVLSHPAVWNKESNQHDRFNDELPLESGPECWQWCSTQKLWHCKVPWSCVENTILLYDKTEGLWTEGNHCSCRRSGDMYWLEKEGLTWCDMLETPLCSELHRHGVQPMQRATITRKGDGELVSGHWYCFCFDSLKFSEEESALLWVNRRSRSAPFWTHTEKSTPITSLLSWTSITKPLILCSSGPYPSFPVFTLDWPQFIWRWWQHSEKCIRNTCIKCRYSVPQLIQQQNSEQRFVLETLGQ